MVEIVHLRYFVAVAETLHFGRAAERLKITQPALSQQIAKLEKLLGVQLLERSRQAVKLTYAGEMFLAEARRAIDQFDAALSLARRAAGGEVGSLSLGYLGPHCTALSRTPSASFGSDFRMLSSSCAS